MLELEILCSEVINELRKENYTELNIKKHQNTYIDFIKYAHLKNEIYFSDSLMIDYFSERYSADISESNSKRSYWVNQRLTHLKKVKCFVKNGNIHYFKSEGNKTKSTCPSCFQPAFENYIEYIMNFDYADSTIKEFRFTTIMFLKYLSNHGINTFKILTPVIITDFFKDKSYYSKSYLKIMVKCLRRFLNYLYFEKYIDGDLSFALPEIHLIRNAFLPPIIDPTDIDELLRSIDTSLPIGKRDYAILMIAAKTGLRTSDIKRLSIHDIDWREHTISIIQKKTQIPLKVPFPKDVGWAIIDYLKNGRPVSSDNILFIRHSPEGGRFSDKNTLHEILHKQIRITGIQLHSNNYHGLHSLRSSYAKRLFDFNTPLPVISNLLGHQSTTPTSRYLSIDFDRLRECTIDVDEVLKNG